MIKHREEPMTKSQARARILRAAEMIAGGEKTMLIHCMEIPLFYRVDEFFNLRADDHTGLNSEIRVLMLLWFAEVGLK